MEKRARGEAVRFGRSGFVLKAFCLLLVKVGFGGKVRKREIGHNEDSRGDRNISKTVTLRRLRNIRSVKVVAS